MKDLQKITILGFLALTALTSSCSSTKDDPLIIPPKFNELPDPNNPEKTPEQKDQDFEKLKELLLKSE